jgi:hypothetical protein
MEHWDVVKVVIPGAFIQADMDAGIFMKLESTVIYLLLELEKNMQLSPMLQAQQKVLHALHRQHSEQHCCCGGSFQSHYKVGDSKSIYTNHVWPTKKANSHNSLSYDMWTT